MNFLGSLIAAALIVAVYAWNTEPELRCVTALQNMKAHDMCRLLKECDITQSDISWDLYWQEIADEDCGVKEE